MNRNDALELIFWIPIGLLSMLYLLVSRSSEISEQSSDNAAITNETNAMPPQQQHDRVIYNLMENATVINTHGEFCKVLRYAAYKQRLDENSDETTASSTLTPISILLWAQLLSSPTDEYVTDFTNILANAPMDAFFFETEGVSFSMSKNKPFEFVLVDSSYLYQIADAEQDPDTFSDRFRGCEENNDNRDGCVFSNPRGDSILISPMPQNDMANNVYGHLGAFLRRAPRNEVVPFWKLVMKTYLRRLESVWVDDNDARVWLSTDGSGVAWLHVRLDPVPKYYDYKPYAEGG